MDELKQFLTPHAILFLIFAIWGIWMLVTYLRQKHPFLSFLIGAGSGIAVLLLWNGYGDLLGYHPPLTVCTISVSAVGGIPALLLLWGLELLAVTK